jgi:hypothetical protein
MSLVLWKQGLSFLYRDQRRPNECIFRENPWPGELLLDAFTAELSGTPRKAGTFDFAVQVPDYDKRAGKRQGFGAIIRMEP